MKAAIVVVIALGIGFAVRLLLGLPGVPEGIREIFWQGGNFFNLFCFGLFVVGLGLGGAWCGRLLRFATLPALALPPLAAALSIAAYACLFLSVTPESLHDLIGVPLVTQAARQAELVPLLGFLIPIGQQFPQLANWLESAIRFAALYAPLPILTALFIVSACDFVTMSERSALRNVPLVLSAGLLLILCKLIVVDYHATSNIVELLAPPTIASLPAIAWLYTAIGVLAFGSVLLWLSIIRILPIWIAALAWTVSVALSSFLLIWSLDPSVEKYGKKFAAMDFLITGERVVALHDSVRIAVVMVLLGILGVVLVWGMWFVIPRRRVVFRSAPR